MEKLSYTEKIINDDLCRRIMKLEFGYEKCSCIGSTSKLTGALRVYTSKANKNRQNVEPFLDSLFVLKVQYPTDIIMGKSCLVSRINPLSDAEKDRGTIPADVYFLVKRKKLVKFISEVINDDKPGATFQLSDYGNIVYTRLHRKSTTQKSFDELRVLKAVLREECKSEDIEFAHRVSFISKMLKSTTCARTIRM